MKKNPKTSPFIALCFGLVLVSGLVISCATGGPGPMTVAPAGENISADAQCPVCGMYAARYPKFAPKVIFKDGMMAAFDGCKDMYRYLLDMNRYGQGRTDADVLRIEVKDFSSGEWKDGRTAHYISGSSVRGPMGPELIPFSSREKAENFQQENGGTLLTHEQIMSTGLSALPGPMSMHH